MLRLAVPGLSAPRRSLTSSTTPCRPRAASSDAKSVRVRSPLCSLWVERSLPRWQPASHSSKAPPGARLQIVGGGSVEGSEDAKLESLGVPPGAVVRPEPARQPRRRGPLKSSIVAALIVGILSLIGSLSLAFAIQSSFANLTHALGPAARSVASDSLRKSSIGLEALVIPGLKYGLDVVFRFCGWSH